MRPLPSVKTLGRVAGITPEKAKELRELVEKKRKTTDYKSVQEWERECHHRPRYAERLMCAINEIVDGHGVEAVWREGEGPSSCVGTPAFEYINMGDTYIQTVIRNCDTGRIFVSDWGSVVERGNYR